MNKRYYLPLFFFLLVLIFDLISINAHTALESQQNQENKIDIILKSEADLLMQEEMLKLFKSNSIDFNELNKIKSIESKLQAKQLSVKLFSADQLIFWSGKIGTNQICKSYNKDLIKIDICTNPIAVNNNLQLKNKGANRPVNIQRISLSLYLLSLFLLILVSISQNHAFPVLGLILIRLMLFFIPWTRNYSDLDTMKSIFSVTNYCSIDLLIDAILIFGIISIFIKKQYLISKNDNTKRILHGGIFILILALISHIRLVQMLVNSDDVLNNFSDISQFGSTDILCLTTILLLLLSIFIYSNSLFVAIKRSTLNKKQTYLSALVSVVIAQVLSVGIGLDLNVWILAVFLCSWILLFDLFTDVKQKNITWLIWWAIFLSVYLSSILFNFDIKREIKTRSEFLAEAIKDTPSSEVINKLETTELILLDTIINNLLDVPEGMKPDKEDFLDYLKTLTTLQLTDVNISDAEGQSIFSNSNQKFNKGNLVSINSYILFDQIRNQIWFTRKANDNFQYSVLVNLNENPIQGAYNFNYYRDDDLIHSDFKLNSNSLSQIKSSSKDYVFMDSHVFVKWENGNKLLISKKSFDSLIKPIALFSLLFVMVILFGILLSIGNIWLKFLPAEWPFKIQRIDSLNSKIQVSLILVILLSFIVIAFITNSFLNNFLSKEKEKYYRNKIVTISNDLGFQTDIANTSDEMVAIASNFSERISSIHDVDIKIHAIDSKNKSIPYFNYIYFTKNRNQSAFTEEKEGFATSYVPMKFNNKTVAYASISHRNSEKNEVKVFDFLGSIFNVYVFLFLIASVLAIFLARSITKPLALLNQKLGKLKLGKQNELIAWDRDDEIGNLITNYNNMVHQLEESAQVLAKTERDSAWREMAKQVAHEIKNPLTPMKLSIQYLEKAIKQKPEEAIALSKRISATLLEQIDNLAEIANAFGNFAELPQSSNVKIEINEVVEMVHNLFRKREDMEITLAVPIDPIYVYADKNQLIRVLNNLVKNAVESVPQSRRGTIKLKLYTQNENAIIKVSDNGEGIPDDMQDKIFQPKFTTKDSGSGLGLAISANMIESMNGRLYFESKQGVGTDFYIELDIIRPSNYQDQDKRITLD